MASTELAVRCDWRERLRLPISLKLQYWLKSGQHADGETSNISGGGILFQSARRFAVASTIDVEAAWPFPWTGRCPLQLCIRGRVVRSNGLGTALAIEKYEFHTPCGPGRRVKSPMRRQRLVRQALESVRRTKTALILDDDLACILAASPAVVQFGYTAVPAHTVQEANSLIDELGATVDLLIVNHAVPGAEDLTLRLEAENPKLIVVPLVAESEAECEFSEPGTPVTIQKPATDEEAVSRYWIERLCEVLG